MIKYYNTIVQFESRMAFKINFNNDPDAIEWCHENDNLIHSLDILKGRRVEIVEITEDEWLLLNIK